METIADTKLERAYDFIDNNKKEMVDMLEKIVNIESFGFSKEDVNKVRSAERRVGKEC